MLVGKAVRQKVLDLRARPAAEAQTILRERYDCPCMLELEQMSPNTFDRHEQRTTEQLAKVYMISMELQKRRKLSMLSEPAPTNTPAEGPREPVWASSSTSSSCSPPPAPPTRRRQAAHSLRAVASPPAAAAATLAAGSRKRLRSSPPLPPPPPQPTSTLTPAIPRLRSPEASPTYYIL